LNGSQDRLYNPVQVLVDLGVPEPQTAKPTMVQLFVARLITCDHHVGAMLPAIKLDDDPLLKAGEIGDEAPDRNLSTEVQSCSTQKAQLTPELAFAGGRSLAQAASQFDWKRGLRPAHDSLTTDPLWRPSNNRCAITDRSSPCRVNGGAVQSAAPVPTPVPPLRGGGSDASFGHQYVTLRST